MEIVDYIFAPTCDDMIIASLRHLLQVHHTEFKSHSKLCITRHEVLKRSAALFILKTAETHNIPLSAMEILCSDVTSLVEMCLRESNAMPFAGLETNHMQTKYFKENLSLLVR